MLRTKLATIGRSAAVIEFAMDRSILEANDNVLDVTGYGREERVAYHPCPSVVPEEATSTECRTYWEALAAGEAGRAAAMAPQAPRE